MRKNSRFSVTFFRVFPDTFENYRTFFTFDPLKQWFPAFFFSGAFYWTQIGHGALL
jgi:hypothetical protein